MSRCVVTACIVTALAVPAAALAGRVDSTPSKACIAARAHVTYLNNQIALARKQLPNTSPTVGSKVNPTRTHQLQQRIAQLQAQLPAARAAVAKACKQEPGADLAAYNGNYRITLSGTRFIGNFAVNNGVLQGDLVSVAPLDPETGIVNVHVTFAGAQCTPDPLPVHINAGTGIVIGKEGLSCSLGGQSASGNLTGYRP